MREFIVLTSWRQGKDIEASRFSYGTARFNKSYDKPSIFTGYYGTLPGGSNAKYWSFPIWFVVAGFALLGLLIRWNLKFSLKQMFIIVTLFAVCLGLGAF